jgi:hypothetical protein
MKDFAVATWDRAVRDLESARKLADTDPDSAASRAYYAVFHALTAMFALRNESFSKHSAIRAALHRDLVQPGILTEQNGRDYDFLMDLRETGDYGGVSGVTSESIQKALTKAATFLNAVAKACPELAESC